MSSGGEQLDFPPMPGSFISATCYLRSGLAAVVRVWNLVQIVSGDIFFGGGCCFACERVCILGIFLRLFLPMMWAVTSFVK